jgi:3-dehydro-L-gulonate 2-dehydrogenase
MTNNSETIRISSKEMEQTFHSILTQHNFSDEKAKICAKIFTENTLDGVYTHGVYRFMRFIQYIKDGIVKPHAEAKCKSTFGNMEQWDGHLGPGPVNALICTDRVMAIAKQNGLGCVALANTNHWMRGGTYGWKAAKEGFVFIGWTNTTANMPAWGAKDCKLGNNPLVIAVPYKDEAIVLDMATSQFSYGALELYDLKNEKIPVFGGYDTKGNLSDNPREILNSRRTLPIGYWKGAGLSLLLDILATIFSGGLSTAEISREKLEYGVSQIYMAIDLSKLSNSKSIQTAIQSIIDDYHQSVPVEDSRKVPYPGERILKVREENSKNGIPVLKKVWDEIHALL